MQEITCANCGAKLRLGSVYCASCGHEAQIVSDSSLLEDELLQELLKEENPSQKSKGKESSKSSGASPKSPKKRSHKSLILTLSCLFALLALCGILIPVLIKNRNYNSFDYQIQSGEEHFEEGRYAEALENYKRAKELGKPSLLSLYQMAEIYQKSNDPESAISQLHEIISEYPEETKAYEQLIALYAQMEDSESILKLKESVTDKSLLELFAEYTVEMPEFDTSPGTYDDWLSIGLTGKEDCEILYTTDGSDPITQGQVYEKAFLMKEQGTLEIKAVCRNQYDIYSDVLEGTFIVKYQKPKMPVASPSSGNFQSPAVIELTGSEESRMYYTWDGSVPTVDSQEYTGPISVPEGNNILSVILIDKHGMVSDILKCNYRYHPY